MSRRLSAMGSSRKSVQQHHVSQLNAFHIPTIFENDMLEVSSDNKVGAEDALIAAAASNDIVQLRLLVEQTHVDIHARENAALVTAAANGHMNVVRYLVKQNGGVVGPEAVRASVLAAVHAGEYEIMSYLLAHEDHGDDIQDLDSSLHLTL